MKRQLAGRTLKIDMTNRMDINQEQYDKIAEQIHSDTSPVGIDAKKTHILILQLLMNIDARLKRIEEKSEAM